MEVEVSSLKASFEEHKKETTEHLDRMDKKLDELLALRNKGAGVFWILSMVVGTGGIWGLIQFIHYLFPWSK